MKLVLGMLKSGDQVYIENVKGRLVNGQGPSRPLAPIAVKVL
jgi:hypothetical protein